jgi:peptidoglycan/LPS O-acetylase OafA/YrhL
MFLKIVNFFKVDFHNDRIYGFDIIRTIAILSVLLGHGTFIIPGKPGSFYMNACEFLDGVFVFFILSGFLIGQLLIYTIENKPVNKETLLNFLKKRLLRTVPAYYATLIVLILLSLITINGFGNLKLLLYFVFMQNFATSHPFFFAEAWTLSIEVWFYILIPTTIFLLKGYFKLSDKKSILYTVFIFVTLSFVTRWLRSLNYNELDGVIIDQIFRKQVITRIDSVTFGIIGAYVFKYYNAIWDRYKYIYLCIGVALFFYTKFPLFEETVFYRMVLFYTLQSTSFLLILPFFGTIKKGSGAVYNVITLLSYVSFSIYLINLNIVQTFILNNIGFEKLGEITGMVTKYILYLVISIFGGIIMYKNVELPFMNMRNKIK